MAGQEEHFLPISAPLGTSSMLSMLLLYRRSFRLSGMLSAVLLTTACPADSARTPARRTGPASLPSKAPESREGLGPVRVHRVADPGVGSVNSYILESEHSLILIDAQRSLSSAKRVRSRLARLGKPLRAILLTHAHPDHYMGLAAFTENRPDLPVYATPEVTDIIRNDRYGYSRATRAVLPEDSGPQVVLPNRNLDVGERVSLDDIDLYSQDFGEGEAAAMTVFVDRRHQRVFVGDLIANGMTPFLLESRLRAWVTQLKTLKARYEGFQAFPGHGRPGPVEELVDAQIVYLLAFEESVAARVADGTWSDSDRAAVVHGFEQRYPGYRPVAQIPNLLALNADAVAQAMLQGTNKMSKSRN